MRIAGTAWSVNPATVVALRYQVDSAARPARFGNRVESIWPSGVMSDAVGSSSSTIRTIGVVEGPALAASKDSEPNASLAGDATRNTISE